MKEADIECVVLDGGDVSIDRTNHLATDPTLVLDCLYSFSGPIRSSISLRYLYEFYGRVDFHEILETKKLSKIISTIFSCRK